MRSPQRATVHTDCPGGPQLDERRGAFVPGARFQPMVPYRTVRHSSDDVVVSAVVQKQGIHRDTLKDVVRGACGGVGPFLRPRA
jgi:hypothetical protein